MAACAFNAAAQDAASVSGLTVEAPACASESPGPPATETPEPWLLMKSLQGTEIGSTLVGSRVNVYGWTDLSFTASTDRNSNSPLGFNYLANSFLLDQNWLRIDRPVDTDSSEPSFGFRSDTILPGSDYRFTLARGLFSAQLTADQGGRIGTGSTQSSSTLKPIFRAWPREWTSRSDIFFRNMASRRPTPSTRLYSRTPTPISTTLSRTRGF